MAIDLLKNVSDRNGNVCEIIAVEVRNICSAELLAIPFENFIEAYDEHIDPKDLEIAKLKETIRKLKEKKETKKERKKRRPNFTEKEKEEVRGYIRAGAKDAEIAGFYDASDKTIANVRKELKKNGEKV